jgi:hypothetical protein
MNVIKINLLEPKWSGTYLLCTGTEIIFAFSPKPGLFKFPYGTYGINQIYKIIAY